MKRLRFLKIKDFLCMILFLILYPISFLFRPFIRDLWLISEEKYEARDNGYWFFKFVREHYPKQNIAYVISKKSPDYNKVATLGKIVKWGSLKHWILYFCAKKNISSQKGAKPNAAVFYFFEVVFPIVKSHRVFLQHGITINDAKWLYYDRCRFDLFVCATKDEYEFVKSQFKYPDSKIALLGFSRFDNLNDDIKESNVILIMPTWRDWLIGTTTNGEKVEDNKKFTDTEYFKNWNSLLNDEIFIKFIESNNIKVYFYPHRNMQNHINSFTCSSSNVVITNSRNYDVQTLLKTASLLVTDYSSVFFDFAYMLKPVVFFQFDEKKYREHQYQKGYFDYSNNSFSSVGYDKNTIIDILKNYHKNDFELSDHNKNLTKKYFCFNDKNNSQRIYNKLKGN